jgi:predicted nucleotidyltransferase component of viral defense system
MRLHENTELFKEAVRFTADKMGMAEIYVEKDYWLTYTLFHLFHDEEIKSFAVFKGGTSLSKCFKLVDRFSEDIDLVVIQDGSENPNQLKKKLKKIITKVRLVLEEEYIEGFTNNGGNIKKVAFKYDKAFSGEYGQIRDKIAIEASVFGNSEPHSIMEVSSFIIKNI